MTDQQEQIQLDSLDIDRSAIVGHPAERGAVRPLQLGPGARIRSGSVIYSASTIGAGLNLGHHVVVREECEISDDVSIWSNTVVDYGCRIGRGVKIHSNCYIAQFTVLEDDVFIAPGVSIANDLYPGDQASAAVMRGPIIRAGAQIGAGTTILPYVEIGAGALVGAGSVVTRDVPPGMVVYGSPASVAKPVSDLRPISGRVPGTTTNGSTHQDEEIIT